MDTVKYRRPSFFKPYNMHSVYNKNIDNLDLTDCSDNALKIRKDMLTGEHVLWGIPFSLGGKGDENNLLIVDKGPVQFEFPEPVSHRYLIFLHAADYKESVSCDDGIFRPMRGDPELGETVCEYVFVYEDNTTASIPVRRRFNINEFTTNWGEFSFECVPHLKPDSVLTNTEELKKDKKPKWDWGRSQTRVISSERASGTCHWLYAAENPDTAKKLKGIRFIPREGVAFIFGITGCDLDTNPLRWDTRKKLKLTLPEEMGLDAYGDYGNFEIDMGQVISVLPVLDYDNAGWETGYNNKEPVVSKTSLIIEYSANPAARLYVGKAGETVIPLDSLDTSDKRHDAFTCCSVKEARKPVIIRIVDKKYGKPVPVKIHIHGEHGEYLPPVNRHRIPNPYWFEDYSADFAHGRHYCTYINGEAQYRLPLGEVFVEVSKGFEIKPVKKKFIIGPDTDNITIELENVLNWRDKGWVSADTHVHFLSPQTALLEGEAEGVNVVNLLASQWGELFTNIGDFDGKTTIGSREAGGSGEYLVRVGTENRQHILGHISLLGYEGSMILPLTTGGPEESAFGDPVEETLSGWAKKCREQNGISILPHFPHPRAEGAAALVLELIDGIEMTSWGYLYRGISPYSISDWYRYLNCGYHVPVVGGTDKMSADTAVGTVRTYALIEDDIFDYENWKKAIRKGHTFVTFGPLLEFQVNGRNAGEVIKLKKGGASLDVEWHTASVTVPVTKVELVVNGETKYVKNLDPANMESSGSWTFRTEESCWMALRVRGCQPGKPEIIIAHSSAVMVIVDGKKCFNSLDAMTILDQIEGAAAYVRNLGTKAEENSLRKILMTLTSAHRALHNRLHREGIYHNHTAVDDHHL